MNSNYIGLGEFVTFILGFVSFAALFWAGFLYYKEILLRRNKSSLASLSGMARHSDDSSPKPADASAAQVSDLNTCNEPTSGISL